MKRGRVELVKPLAFIDQPEQLIENQGEKKHPLGAALCMCVYVRERERERERRSDGQASSYSLYTFMSILVFFYFWFWFFIASAGLSLYPSFLFLRTERAQPKLLRRRGFAPNASVPM